MKKTLLTLIFAGLFSCDGGYSYSERRVPTTQAERDAIVAHVQAILPKQWPQNLGDDDQDLEDLIEAAHREAQKVICKPTMWEFRTNGSTTGRWHYVENHK